MKRIITTVGLIIFSFAPMWAQADFVGYYDVSNWTISNDNPDACSAAGGVDASGAPASVIVIECDSGFTVNEPSTISLTIAAAVDGIFSFDWFQGGADQLFAGGGYYVDSKQVLYAPFSGSNQSGSVSVSVSAGQTIGWYINSTDSIYGSSTLTISNFSAPVSAVPEPSTLALLGLGLAGMGMTRRRKKV